MFDRKAYQREWEQEHKGERTQYHKKYYEEHKDLLRIEVLSFYGDGKPVCVVCSEERLPCLSIDHINDDGKEQRKLFGFSSSTRLYYWLKRNNYPSGYQTLCMNCQCIKRNSFNQGRRSVSDIQ